MGLNASFGLTLAVIGLGAVWGCADGRNQLSPVSPSTLSSSPSPAARGVSRTPLQRVDEDATATMTLHHQEIHRLPYRILGRFHRRMGLQFRSS